MIMQQLIKDNYQIKTKKKYKVKFGNKTTFI